MQSNLMQSNRTFSSCIPSAPAPAIKDQDPTPDTLEFSLESSSDMCTSAHATDKMRSEYGKLVYLLMDSADENIQELIEFRCVRPLRTVYTLLGTPPIP